MSDHRQELFSRVATHLLTQMETSYSDKLGQCAYRAGGLRCAIGCLIDDAHYYFELEGYPVRTGPVMAALEGSLGYHLNSQDMLVLDDLQTLHDNGNPMGWLDELHELATEYDLSMPEAVSW